MAIPQRAPKPLRDHLAALLRRCPVPSADAAIVSLSIPWPRCTDGLPPGLEGAFFYRAVPSAGDLILGLGIACGLEACGPTRFTVLDRTLRAWQEHWHCPEAGGNPNGGAGAFLGFAFDPEDEMRGPWAQWPNAGAYVPLVTLRCSGATCTLVFSAGRAALEQPERLLERWLTTAAPLLRDRRELPRGAGSRLRVERLDSAADRAQWLSLAGSAGEAIRAARFDKVVPVRTVPVRTSHPIEPARVLAELARRYPSCAVWAARPRGRTLLGATPECLVRLRDRHVECDALGGTGPSGPARDPAAALLADTKLRHEHRLVVDTLARVLGTLTLDLRVPPCPEVLTFQHLCHLRTRVVATARAGLSLLNLAERLHPTPATGGAPAVAAVEWLRAAGNATRGWYTGGLGWLDRTGSGEISVPLRCALVDGAEATLFAGAGVVAGSDPQAEFAETELKLAGLLEALPWGY